MIFHESKCHQDFKAIQNGTAHTLEDFDIISKEQYLVGMGFYDFLDQSTTKMLIAAKPNSVTHVVFLSGNKNTDIFVRFDSFGRIIEADMKNPLPPANIYEDDVFDFTLNGEANILCFHFAHAIHQF